MRIANRFLAPLLAAALVVAGIVAAAEIVLAALGDAHWVAPWRTWHRWALTHTWTSAAAEITCYALIAAGLLVLFLAFAPHRALDLEARSESPDVTARVRVNALESSLARTAQGVDGIGSATARVSRRAVRVTARSNRRDVGGLKDAVNQAVTDQLQRVRLIEQPELRVQVRSRGD